MNSINLMGRTTGDLTLSTTASGKMVCSFTLAVHRPFTKDATDFIDCVVWDKQAENITTYVKKGQQIWVSGVLTTRNYEDKNGNKRKVTEVNVNQWGFAEAKREQQEPHSMPPADYMASQYQAQGQAVNQAPAYEKISSDDELPF